MGLRAFVCVVLAFWRLQESLADWDSSGKNLTWIYDVKNPVTTQNQSYKLNTETGAFRYHFDISIVDTFKFEAQSSDAVTLGCYGWKDANKKWHATNYVADSHGWRTIFDIEQPIVVFPTFDEQSTRAFIDILPQCIVHEIDSAPLRLANFTTYRPPTRPSKAARHDDHVPHESERVHHISEPPPSRRGPLKLTPISNGGQPGFGGKLGSRGSSPQTSQNGGPSPIRRPATYKGSANNVPPGSSGLGPTSTDFQTRQSKEGTSRRPFSGITPGGSPLNKESGQNTQETLKVNSHASPTEPSVSVSRGSQRFNGKTDSRGDRIAVSIGRPGSPSASQSQGFDGLSKRPQLDGIASSGQTPAAFRPTSTQKVSPQALGGHRPGTPSGLQPEGFDASSKRPSFGGTNISGSIPSTFGPSSPKGASSQTFGGGTPGSPSGSQPQGTDGSKRPQSDGTTSSGKTPAAFGTSLTQGGSPQYSGGRKPGDSTAGSPTGSQPQGFDASSKGPSFDRTNISGSIPSTFGPSSPQGGSSQTFGGGTPGSPSGSQPQGIDGSKRPPYDGTSSGKTPAAFGTSLTQGGLPQSLGGRQPGDSKPSSPTGSQPQGFGASSKRPSFDGANIFGSIPSTFGPSSPKGGLLQSIGGGTPGSPTGSQPQGFDASSKRPSFDGTNISGSIPSTFGPSSPKGASSQIIGGGIPGSPSGSQPQGIDGSKRPSFDGTFSGKTPAAFGTTSTKDGLPQSLGGRQPGDNKPDSPTGSQRQGFDASSRKPSFDGANISGSIPSTFGPSSPNGASSQTFGGGTPGSPSVSQPQGIDGSKRPPFDGTTSSGKTPATFGTSLTQGGSPQSSGGRQPGDSKPSSPTGSQPQGFGASSKRPSFDRANISGSILSTFGPSSPKGGSSQSIGGGTPGSPSGSQPQGIDGSKRPPFDGTVSSGKTPAAFGTSLTQGGSPQYSGGRKPGDSTAGSPTGSQPQGFDASSKRPSFDGINISGSIPSTFGPSSPKGGSSQTIGFGTPGSPSGSQPQGIDGSKRPPYDGTSSGKTPAAFGTSLTQGGLPQSLGGRQPGDSKPSSPTGSQPQGFGASSKRPSFDGANIFGSIPSTFGPSSPKGGLSQSIGGGTPGSPTGSQLQGFDASSKRPSFDGTNISGSIPSTFGPSSPKGGSSQSIGGGTPGSPSGSQPQGIDGSKRPPFDGTVSSGKTPAAFGTSLTQGGSPQYSGGRKPGDSTAGSPTGSQPQGFDASSKRPSFDGTNISGSIQSTFGPSSPKGGSSQSIGGGTPGSPSGSQPQGIDGSRRPPFDGTVSSGKTPAAFGTSLTQGGSPQYSGGRKPGDSTAGSPTGSQPQGFDASSKRPSFDGINISGSIPSTFGPSSPKGGSSQTIGFGTPGSPSGSQPQGIHGSKRPPYDGTSSGKTPAAFGTSLTQGGLPQSLGGRQPSDSKPSSPTGSQPQGFGASSKRPSFDGANIFGSIPSTFGPSSPKGGLSQSIGGGTPGSPTGSQLQGFDASSKRPSFDGTNISGSIPSTFDPSSPKGASSQIIGGGTPGSPSGSQPQGIDGSKRPSFDGTFSGKTPAAFGTTSTKDGLPQSLGGRQPGDNKPDSPTGSQPQGFDASSRKPSFDGANISGSKPSTFGPSSPKGASSQTSGGGTPGSPSESQPQGIDGSKRPPFDGTTSSGKTPATFGTPLTQGGSPQYSGGRQPGDSKPSSPTGSQPQGFGASSKRPSFDRANISGSILSTFGPSSPKGGSSQSIGGGTPGSPSGSQPQGIDGSKRPPFDGTVSSGKTPAAFGTSLTQGGSPQYSGGRKPGDSTAGSPTGSQPQGFDASSKRPSFDGINISGSIPSTFGPSSPKGGSSQTIGFGTPGSPSGSQPQGIDGSKRPPYDGTSSGKTPAAFGTPLTQGGSPQYSGGRQPGDSKPSSPTGSQPQGFGASSKRPSFDRANISGSILSTFGPSSPKGGSSQSIGGGTPGSPSGSQPQGIDGSKRPPFDGTVSSGKTPAAFGTSLTQGGSPQYSGGRKPGDSTAGSPTGSQPQGFGASSKRPSFDGANIFGSIPSTFGPSSPKGGLSQSIGGGTPGSPTGSQLQGFDASSKRPSFDGTNISGSIPSTFGPSSPKGGSSQSIGGGTPGSPSGSQPQGIDGSKRPPFDGTVSSGKTPAAFGTSLTQGGSPQYSGGRKPGDSTAGSPTGSQPQGFDASSKRPSFDGTNISGSISQPQGIEGSRRPPFDGTSSGKTPAAFGISLTQGGSPQSSGGRQPGDSKPSSPTGSQPQGFDASSKRPSFDGANIFGSIPSTFGPSPSGSQPQGIDGSKRPPFDLTSSGKTPATFGTTPTKNGFPQSFGGRQPGDSKPGSPTGSQPQGFDDGTSSGKIPATFGTSLTTNGLPQSFGGRQPGDSTPGIPTGSKPQGFESSSKRPSFNGTKISGSIPSTFGLSSPKGASSQTIAGGTPGSPSGSQPQGIDGSKRPPFDGTSSGKTPSAFGISLTQGGSPQSSGGRQPGDSKPSSPTGSQPQGFDTSSKRPSFDGTNISGSIPSTFGASPSGSQPQGIDGSKRPPFDLTSSGKTPATFGTTPTKNGFPQSFGGRQPGDSKPGSPTGSQPQGFDDGTSSGIIPATFGTSLTTNGSPQSSGGRQPGDSTPGIPTGSQPQGFDASSKRPSYDGTNISGSIPSTFGPSSPKGGSSQTIGGGTPGSPSGSQSQGIDGSKRPPFDLTSSGKSPATFGTTPTKNGLPQSFGGRQPGDSKPGSPTGSQPQGFDDGTSSGKIPATFGTTSTKNGLPQSFGGRQPGDSKPGSPPGSQPQGFDDGTSSGKIPATFGTTSTKNGLPQSFGGRQPGDSKPGSPTGSQPQSFDASSKRPSFDGTNISGSISQPQGIDGSKRPPLDGTSSGKTPAAFGISLTQGGSPQSPGGRQPGDSTPGIPTGSQPQGLDASSKRPSFDGTNISGSIPSTFGLSSPKGTSSQTIVGGTPGSPSGSQPQGIDGSKRPPFDGTSSGKTPSAFGISLTQGGSPQSSGGRQPGDSKPSSPTGSQPQGFDDGISSGKIPATFGTTSTKNGLPQSFGGRQPGDSKPGSPTGSQPQGFDASSKRLSFDGTNISGSISQPQGIDGSKRPPFDGTSSGKTPAAFGISLTQGGSPQSPGGRQPGDSTPGIPTGSQPQGLDASSKRPSFDGTNISGSIPSTFGPSSPKGASSQTIGGGGPGSPSGSQPQGIDGSKRPPFDVTSSGKIPATFGTTSTKNGLPQSFRGRQPGDSKPSSPTGSQSQGFDASSKRPSFDGTNISGSIPSTFGPSSPKGGSSQTIGGGTPGSPSGSQPQGIDGSKRPPFDVTSSGKIPSTFGTTSTKNGLPQSFGGRQPGDSKPGIPTGSQPQGFDALSKRPSFDGTNISGSIPSTFGPSSPKGGSSQTIGGGTPGSPAGSQPQGIDGSKRPPFDGTSSGKIPAAFGATSTQYGSPQRSGDRNPADRRPGSPTGSQPQGFDASSKRPSFDGTNISGSPPSVFGPTSTKGGPSQAIASGRPGSPSGSRPHDSDGSKRPLFDGTTSSGKTQAAFSTISTQDGSPQTSGGLKPGDSRPGSPTESQLQGSDGSNRPPLVGTSSRKTSAAFGTTSTQDGSPQSSGGGGPADSRPSSPTALQPLGFDSSTKRPLFDGTASPGKTPVAFGPTSTRGGSPQISGGTRPGIQSGYQSQGFDSSSKRPSFDGTNISAFGPSHGGAPLIFGGDKPTGGRPSSTSGAQPPSLSGSYKGPPYDGTRFSGPPTIIYGEPVTPPPCDSDHQGSPVILVGMIPSKVGYEGILPAGPYDSTKPGSPPILVGVYPSRLDYEETVPTTPSSPGGSPSSRPTKTSSGRPPYATSLPERSPEDSQSKTSVLPSDSPKAFAVGKDTSSSAYPTQRPYGGTSTSTQSVLPQATNAPSYKDVKPTNPPGSYLPGRPDTSTSAVPKLQDSGRTPKFQITPGQYPVILYIPSAASPYGPPRTDSSAPSDDTGQFCSCSCPRRV